MKAALVKNPGATPVYGDFREPASKDGHTIIHVRASALSHFTKARASGSHYSADGVFPAVAGADGVGTTPDGQRVFFVLPEAPFGALAEYALVKTERCIPIPNTLDDITAAAIANPGMSAWAALVERARLQAGETVLVNGGAGTAGRIAVQLAKYLGAGKVIATARNSGEFEQLKALGADVVIPFNLDLLDRVGEKRYEQALIGEFEKGVHVVIDYLWGQSARTVMVAAARGVEDATPVRFVHVGGASGETSIDLPGAGLRSSSLILMGSGLKSVPLPKLMQAVEKTFAAVIPARLQIATQAVPLQHVEQSWRAPGKPRVVFTV